MGLSLQHLTIAFFSAAQNRQHPGAEHALRMAALLALACVATALPAKSRADADAAALVAAIQSRQQSSPEFALEDTLKSLAVEPSAEIKTIRVSEANDAGCTWPSRKPAGVSDDEWQALRHSITPQTGEHGCSSYLLVDMDEDGQRDVLEQTSIGGMGILTGYVAYQRKGPRFVLPTAGHKAETKPSVDDSQELFTINDRDENQWYEMIRLQGRFYIAYVDGSFGEDHVALMRPIDKIPGGAAVSVRYRYQFTVPRRQSFGPEGQQRKVDLSPALQSTIEQALNRYASVRPTKPLAQVCPAPAGASEELRARYAGFEPAPVHYSLETAADFPFWWQGHCHVAQLNTWFGRYDRKEGLFNMLRVRRADRDEEGLEYAVNARRQMTGVLALD